MPIAEVHGPLPAALEDTDFLRRHVRQFLWRRGSDDGESRIVVRRVRDGLPTSLETGLAELRGDDLRAGS